MSQQALNLRASSFAVGNNPINPYVTTNQQNFNLAPKPKQLPNIKQQDYNEIKFTKGNLRETHFQFGSDPPGYSTTKNVHYPAKVAENAKLNDEKLNDLRSHHYLMGQYERTRKTTNNIIYDEKERQPNLQEKQLLQKAKMIAHSHSFREQANTVMTSKYNDEYNKIGNSAVKGGQDQGQIEQRAKELRSSHIMFGQDQKPYETIQKKDYTEKEQDNAAHKKMNFQASHFKLGYQKDSMCSTNDVYHQQQPMCKAELPKEILKDLRSHHFNVGEQGQNYTSEFKRNYQHPNQSGSQKQIISTAQLQQNNFNIGDNETFKTSYQTAYSQNLKRPQTAQQLKARDALDDRGSHFQIGQQGNNFKSEMHTQYQNFGDGNKAGIDENLKRDLQSSHFKFNDIPQNSYQTAQKQAFTQQDIRSGKGELDSNLLKDLKSHHFGFGQQKPNYTSISHTKHQNFMDAKPNNFNKQLANNLRSHHFEFT